MSEKLRFNVVRQHIGDRLYMPGDVREGSLNDLGHLVPRVLERDGAAKAEPAPKNKAEPKPANKAESAPKNKAGA